MLELLLDKLSAEEISLIWRQTCSPPTACMKRDILAAAQTDEATYDAMASLVESAYARHLRPVKTLDDKWQVKIPCTKGGIVSAIFDVKANAEAFVSIVIKAIYVGN